MTFFLQQKLPALLNAVGQAIAADNLRRKYLHDEMGQQPINLIFCNCFAALFVVLQIDRLLV
ncbi:MAG: hypothetical protein AAF716_17200 [Cyanobacteria bacterium P01_D01_bin.1]